MEYDPKDLDIVNLLKKIKKAGGGYPQEMLALRRQSYLKQVIGVIGGAGLALGVRETLKSAKAGGSSTAAAGKVVELVLVAAIVAEAGAVTYFYRDKVLDFFKSFSNEPRVEEVANPPALPSLIPATGLTPTLVETPTFIVPDTPVSTPSPQLAGQPTQQDQETSSTGGGVETTTVGGSGTADGGGSGSQSGSTPDPNVNNNNNGGNGNNGNNGNHYGQTPKPERTKEPGNENSNNNHDDQDNRDRDDD